MMRVSMDLELKDIPGQLILAIQPISEFKGNIVSVIHHREKKTPRGTIPVQIVFEIDSANLEKLNKKLKENGIIIARVGEERLIEKGSVVLIGHIIHSDIRDLIDRIDCTGFAEVVDLDLAMPEINKYSSAYMVIKATGKQELIKAISILRKVAKEKKILVIEPIAEIEEL